MGRGVWTGFWEPYMQMRAMQEQTREREARQAEAHATALWREAQVGMAEREQTLQEEKFAEDKRVTALFEPLEVKRLQAQIEDIGAQKTQREAQAAAAGKAATETTKRAEMTDALRRVKDAHDAWKGGETPGTAAHFLLPDDLPDFKKMVQEVEKAEYDQRLQNAIEQMRLKYPPPAAQAMPQPAQPGAPTDPLTALLGGAAATPVGPEAAQVQPSDVWAQYNAKILYEAAKMVGPGPTEDSWKLYQHPAQERLDREQARKDLEQARKDADSAVRREVETNRAALLKAQAEVAPELAQLKVNADRRADARQAAYLRDVDSRIQARGLSGIIAEGRLDEQRARTAILSAGQGLKERRFSWDTARGIASVTRYAARGELRNVEAQIRDLQTYLRQSHDKAQHLAAIAAPYTDPATAVPGTGGLTKAQADKFIHVDSVEQDERNPISSRSRLNALLAKQAALQDVVRTPGPDEAAVLRSGKTAPTGPPGVGRKAPATSGAMNAFRRKYGMPER